MGPPDSVRVPRAPTYSGTDLTLQAFAYGTITPYSRVFHHVLLAIHAVVICPTTPESKPSGLGYTAFARHY